MNTYFVEVTDTFNGESNDCWTLRYKVTAKSPTAAITKVSKETGYRMRKSYDTGDFVRYDAKKACVCAFVELWGDQPYDVKEL